MALAFMGQELPPGDCVDGRAQTIGEEVANAVTHGIGLVASLIALPVLVIAAVLRHDTWQIVGGAVFGATLVLLYAASTLYHAIPFPSAKRVLRIVDHGAIYLLIAGTYTPFTLGALRGPIGWTILTTIWSLALVGVVAKCVVRVQHQRLSTALYVGMGWLVVLALGPLAARVGPSGLAWLFSGGIFYTAGVWFYARDERIKYAHTAWHGFVAAGSACHFVAVLWYAAPHK